MTFYNANSFESRNYIRIPQVNDAKIGDIASLNNLKQDISPSKNTLASLEKQIGEVAEEIRLEGKREADIIPKIESPSRENKNQQKSKDNNILKEEWSFSRKLTDSMGVVQLSGVAGIGGYSELYETVDGNTLDCGYFVTLDGRKIRIANSKDRFILGVTTISPTVLGNNGDVRWKDKYITDEWGRVKYKDVKIPGLMDEDGNAIIPNHTEKQPVINPLWDKNKQYIPRNLRPEWIPVTLIGQVLVRDDGSSIVNGYCIPNDDGVATNATRGYRVLERRTGNQVLILIRSTTLSGFASK